jgi:hypothetical protein
MANLPDIDALCAGMLSIIDYSLRGQPAAARQSLDASIATVHQHIRALISIPVAGSHLKTLYRVRTGAPDRRMSRRDMFHIPFDKRELVAPQRFSILGVPMLYLGSTLFVCWEELGRPPIENLWISAFRLQAGKSLQVLNLAYRPGYIAELFEQAGTPSAKSPSGDLVVAYCTMWPLIAAATFQVPDKSVAFKVEYVIPQLLMSFIAETRDLVGIRYFSTHVHHPPAASMLSINYVLPAIDSAGSGHCKWLSGLFEVTDPLSWTYAKAVGTQTKVLYHGRSAGVVTLGQGHHVPYSGTEFGHMESVLDTLTFSPV